MPDAAISGEVLPAADSGSVELGFCRASILVQFTSRVAIYLAPTSSFSRHTRAATSHAFVLCVLARECFSSSSAGRWCVVLASRRDAIMVRVCGPRKTCQFLDARSRLVSLLARREASAPRLFFLFLQRRVVSLHDALVPKNAWILWRFSIGGDSWRYL